jgi:hypothetical protein
MASPKIHQCATQDWQRYEYQDMSAPDRLCAMPSCGAFYKAHSAHCVALIVCNMAPNGRASRNSVDENAHLGQKKARAEVELVKEHSFSPVTGVAA